MPYHYLRQWRYLDLATSDSDIQEAIKNPAILHFHRSFLGKPWNVGCTHPGRTLWCELAELVRPRWRKQLDFGDLIRTAVAHRGNMTDLDVCTPESYSMTASLLQVLNQDSTKQ